MTFPMKILLIRQSMDGRLLELRSLAFFLLGGCAAVRLSGDWLASARVARHDEGHRVQFIGGYKVQLLSFEVLKYRSGQITVFHLQTSKNKKHTFCQLFG